MALIKRLSETQTPENVDITRNLSSLQFESALSDEEKEFLVLRSRSHAVLVSHCALTTFMVDVFNTARKTLINLKSLDRQKKTHEVHDDEQNNTLSVGIIGCGRLGRQIAKCLLTFGQLHPNRLKISTRRPETLENLRHKGVECYFNNKRLVSSVHIIIFCVLPSQMPSVAEEIKDSLSPSKIVICPFSSLSLRWLSQMLHSSNMIWPQLHWSGGSANSTLDYNYNIDVSTALENRETLLATCPIGVQKEGLVVSSDQRLAEAVILAVVNMCTDQGLCLDETMAVVHAAVFGDTHKKPLTCGRLTPESFGLDIGKNDEKHFPCYSLVDAFEKGIPVLAAALLENKFLRAAFESRYCHCFEDYVHKRAYGQISG